jgi:hypothetical protein
MVKRPPAHSPHPFFIVGQAPRPAADAHVGPSSARKVHLRKIVILPPKVASITLSNADAKSGFDGAADILERLAARAAELTGESRTGKVTQL